MGAAPQLKPLIQPKNNIESNVLPENVLNQQYDFKPVQENPLQTRPDFRPVESTSRVQEQSNIRLSHNTHDQYNNQSNVRLSAKNTNNSPLNRIPDFTAQNTSPTGVQNNNIIISNNDYAKRLSTPLNENTYNKVTTPHTDYIQKQHSSEINSQNYYSLENNNEHSLSNKFIQKSENIPIMNPEKSYKSTSIPIFQKYNPGNTGPLRVVIDPQDKTQDSVVTQNYRNQISNNSNIRESERINDNR